MYSDIYAYIEADSQICIAKYVAVHTIFFLFSMSLL